MVPAFVSYIMASLAGAAAVLVCLGARRAFLSEWSAWSELLNFVPFVAIGTAILALVPSVIALVILRLTRQTALPAYLVSGLAVGLVVWLVFFRTRPDLPGALQLQWELLVGGVVAGLAYWATRRGFAKLSGLQN